MTRAGSLPVNTRSVLFPLSEAERGYGPTEEGGAKPQRQRERWMDEWRDPVEKDRKRMAGMQRSEAEIYPEGHRTWVAGDDRTAGGEGKECRERRGGFGNACLPTSGSNKAGSVCGLWS